jgi:hypothetical protein
VKFIAIVMLVMLSGCVTSPPRHVENICHIFDGKSGWYKDARKSQKEWGTSIARMMAIMHQESRFQPKAKPPRTTFLWIFPGPRLSSAYGFSQATDGTWDWYIDKSGNWGADRDDFGDAIDFIGWYNRVSLNKSKIVLDDTYNQYLAYHEGHGGFNRRSYNKKAWLRQVAKKVSAKAVTYQTQLNGCEKRLQRSGWWFF